MSVSATVDSERLVSAWLRSDPETVALVGQRVYTELPEDKTWPIVRLTLIDEQAVTGAWGGTLTYQTDSLIQFDVWGGPKATARSIADTIRKRLRYMRGEHTEGTVTGVDLGTFGYLPDDTFEPARPRYRFDVHVYSHPDVQSGS